MLRAAVVANVPPHTQRADATRCAGPSQITLLQATDYGPLRGAIPMKRSLETGGGGLRQEA